MWRQRWRAMWDEAEESTTTEYVFQMCPFTTSMYWFHTCLSVASTGVVAYNHL
jgi:hypothetical protein